MSKKFQVVQGGVVTNVLLFGDSAALADNQITADELSEPFIPPGGVTLMQQDGAGMGWRLVGGALVAPTPVLPTLSKPELIAYASAYQWRRAIGGHTVTIGGTPYRFASDETSYSLMTGKAMRLQMPGAPTSVNWQFEDGSFVTFSTANFMTAATAVADYMQATFDAQPAIFAAIEAGSITTMAQVEAAAWPTA